MSKLLTDEYIDVQAHRDHFEIDETGTSLQEDAAYEAIRQRDVWLRKAWGPKPMESRRTQVQLQ
jgi:hypothetical protein